jgi:hypothetical protein
LADQVRHHTVKNIFKALPKIDDKAKLVEELTSGGNRLHANAMSRSVAGMCAVDMYHENKKQWRQTVSRLFLSKEDTFLDDVIKMRDEGGEVKTKAKRKRKREKSDKQSVEEERLSKQQAPSSLAVDSIVQAMTVPTN